MQGVRWTEEDLAAHKARLAGHKPAASRPSVQLAPGRYATRSAQPAVAAGNTGSPEASVRPFTPATNGGAVASGLSGSDCGARVKAVGKSRALARAMPQAGGRPAPKAKRRHPEQDFQKDCIRFLDAALMPYWRAVHVPNGGTTGGHKAKIIGGIRKAMGVREGYPDLSLIGPNRFVVIELKAPGTRRKLSEAQEGWRDWFRHIGVPWFLVDSHEALIAACQDAGVPLRVRA
jgi:hypothetical protein